MILSWPHIMLVMSNDTFLTIPYVSHVQFYLDYTLCQFCLIRLSSCYSHLKINFLYHTSWQSCQILLSWPHLMSCSHVEFDLLDHAQVLLNDFRIFTNWDGLNLGKKKKKKMCSGAGCLMTFFHALSLDFASSIYFSSSHIWSIQTIQFLLYPKSRSLIKF
jgi:hypothetical protein